jgi:ubiquinone/menaquinone biosynthesis C-methylase UbiE
MNKLADVNNTVMMDIRCNQLFKHSNVKGHVLEIGSGTGINFPCLYNNTNIKSYIGIEPNVHMYSYFNDFIKPYEIPFKIRLLNNSATDMHEVKSNSIDTVIMTLVLCSVPDPLPKDVLLEAHRVLKPGGQFIFLEHILANPQTDPFIFTFQRTIEPIWTIIGDGCRFKPTTIYFDAVKNVYSKVEYQQIRLPTPFFFAKGGVKGKLVK